MKTINILGATGSVGESALSVIGEHLDRFRLQTLTANRNVAKLAQQAIQYKPENVVIFDKSLYKELKSLLSSYHKIKIFAGLEGAQEALTQSTDITIAGITGIACIKPIMYCLPYTKAIALANKEGIICCGTFIKKLAAQYNTQILPLDSEHNAIFQILNSKNRHHIEKIILTASGGPFHLYSLQAMANISVQQALKHPIWKMGHKISIDSATLMNKGLELIEAYHLFDLQVEQLDALIHPQSIIHGFIQYQDGSTLAQMAHPDMRFSIAYALSYPERLPISHISLKIEDFNKMTFMPIDETKFRCYSLAKKALQEGHDRCIILNTANEFAVQSFINGEIKFLEIANIIEKALNQIPKHTITTIDDVFHLIKLTTTYCKTLPYYFAQ